MDSEAEDAGLCIGESSMISTSSSESPARTVSGLGLGSMVEGGSAAAGPAVDAEAAWWPSGCGLAADMLWAGLPGREALAWCAAAGPSA